MHFHVAGNTVFDLRIAQWPDAEAAGDDGWTASNVVLTDDPPTPMLGGCGAAPAYALGRLSHGLNTVSLNTSLGADLFGGLAHLWLVHAGVALLAPPEPGVATSTHIIHAEAERRRSAFYRGHRVDWCRSLEAPTPDWFLAAGYGLVEAADADELTEVCSELAQNGSQIVVDPGPWFAQCATADQLSPLWPHVDVLVGTADELCPYVEDHIEVDDLPKALLKLGVRTAIVKRGAEGASWAQRQNDGHTQTFAVDAGYSVGAGDTFNARLVFGLARGDELSDAVRAACGLATRVVTEGRGVLGAFGDHPAVEGLTPGCDLSGVPVGPLHLDTK
ncbi:MAG: carbohydrate kinase family protein [Candidatus Latescibacterota bacterium]|nr:carbohydrate kinase family protein [Candidatus Latescibacterota bacterium]